MTGSIDREVKSTPIMFTAPMVLALLDGSKTQTRRTVKLNDAGRVARKGKQWHVDDPNAVLACPYGVVGDRLWVKEAIHACDDREWDDGTPCIEYVADRHVHHDAAWVWKRRGLPSMFMPRGLSRITREITNVRLQSLQDISWEDALAEGVRRWEEYISEDPYCILNMHDPRHAFSQLWESINSKRAPWSSNPWVWVVEFAKAMTEPTPTMGAAQTPLETL